MSARRVERVTFIVPVYREFASGNIQGLLETIRAQTIDHHHLATVLAVVCVVNNSPDADADIFAENQATLRWLKTTDFGFRVSAVDLSTNGCERNMGRIRNAGIDEVCRQDATSPEKNVIVHMDADTRFGSNFVQTLIETYAPDVDVVFFQREYELRGGFSPELQRSHEAYALRRAARDLTIFLSRYHEGFATYQISSRLSALLQVQRFKPLAEGEDTQLTRDLLAHAHLLSPDLSVRTEDRVRPDGFTSSRREMTVKTWFPARVLLSELSRRLIGEIRTGRIGFVQARRQFADALRWIFEAEPSVNEDLFSRLATIPSAEFPSVVEMPDSTSFDPFTALFRADVFKAETRPAEFLYRVFQRRLQTEEAQFLEKTFRRLADAQATDSAGGSQLHYLRALLEVLARARLAPADFPSLNAALDFLSRI